MWILNQTRDSLVNLQTGLRIVVMPTNKQKDSEVQLYGVVVQAPAEATLPLGRPMPTGFSNTTLMAGALLEDCQNLLAILTKRLEAYEVTDCPILLPDEYDNACYMLAITGGPLSRHAVGEDEEVTRRLLFKYVQSEWPRIFPRAEMPEDREAAIKQYFEEAKEERYEVVVAPFWTRKAAEELK